jgi:transcriptional regulator with XRE-family HTH domain
MALTPEACRAGRAILQWGVRDLAEKAGIAPGTVTRLERGDAKPWAGNAQKIVAAFALAGVRLIDDDAETGAVRVIGGG